MEIRSEPLPQATTIGLSCSGLVREVPLVARLVACNRKIGTSEFLQPEDVNESRSVQSGHFPLLAKEGCRAIKKWSRSETARTGWSFTNYVSECVLKRVLWLTTLYVSRCRAHAARPSAALRWLRDFLLMPQPPLLCKEGKMPALNGS